MARDTESEHEGDPRKSASPSGGVFRSRRFAPVARRVCSFLACAPRVFARPACAALLPARAACFAPRVRVRWRCSFRVLRAPIALAAVVRAPRAPCPRLCSRPACAPACVRRDARAACERGEVLNAG